MEHIPIRKLKSVAIIRAGEPLNRINANTNNGHKYEVFTLDPTAKQTIITDEVLQPITTSDLILSTVQKRLYEFPDNQPDTIAGLNYVMVTPAASIDRDYLLWWFNESIDAAKQRSLLEQGSSLTRITLSMLKEFTIPLPSLEHQRLIGKIYRTTRRLHGLLAERAELTTQLTNACLNKQIERTNYYA